MTVTAADVKKLREDGRRHHGCQKALTETNGDFEAAKKVIIARGIERAEKKADRETGVARVFSYVHFNGKTGAMVKLACETDFVANTDDFATLGREIAMQVASMAPESVEELLKQDYLRDPKPTIEQLVKGVSGKTGENVQVVTIARL